MVFSMWGDSVKVALWKIQNDDVLQFDVRTEDRATGRVTNCP